MFNKYCDDKKFVQIPSYFSYLFGMKSRGETLKKYI